MSEYDQFLCHRDVHRGLVYKVRKEERERIVMLIEGARHGCRSGDDLDMNLEGLIADLRSEQ